GCASRKPHRPRRPLPLRLVRAAQIQSDRDCAALYEISIHHGSPETGSRLLLGSANKSITDRYVRMGCPHSARRWRYHGHTLRVRQSLPPLKHSLQHQVSCGAFFKLSGFLSNGASDRRSSHSILTASVYQNQEMI